MDTFYIATNYFLETVLFPKSITELYKEVDLGDWEAVKTSLNSDLSMWLGHYITYVVCVVFALLYVLILPFVGIVVCCCRRKGHCGGLEDPFEGKHNTCQQRCCATTLLLLCMIILFSTVISFAITGLMYAETMETGATEVISLSLKETGEYVDIVVSEMVSLYNNVTEHDLPLIQNDIVNIPERCQNTVGQVTELTPLLTELEVYLSELNYTLDFCEQVHAGIGDLTNNSAELEFAIADLSNNMTAELSLCSLTDPYCNLTLGMVQNLSVGPNYIDLPSLESAINSLTNLSSGSNSIFLALNRGWTELYDISAIVTMTAEETLNQSVESLHELQYQLLIFINLSTASLMKLDFKEAADVMSTDIAPVVADAGLVTLCICLALLFLLCIICILGFVSLAFGSCGKRPLPGAGCCNKGKGSWILLCTNYTFFLSLWLVMLSMTMLFIAGSIVHNDICHNLVDPTHDPEGSDTLDEIFMGHLNINTSLKKTLHNCKDNTAIYTALDLQDLGTEYNISWITDLDRLGYMDALESLGTLNYSAVEHLDILSSDLEQSLVWLDVTLQSIEFSMYRTALTADITTVDLDLFREVLLEAADNSSEESRSNLYLSYAEQVTLLQEAFVLPMNDTAIQALGSLQQVYGFSQTLNISQYISDLDTAEATLNNDLVQHTMDDLASDIYNITTQLMSEIEVYLKEDLGPCKGIYDSYSYSTAAVCVDFLYPLNTIWFMTGITLLLLPLLWLPVAFKLAGLFGKTDEYAEPFPSFTRMSFHRHNYNNNRSPQRSRSNHGHDIQVELAMHRLGDPRYRRSRAPISVAAGTTSSSSRNCLILGDDGDLRLSETDLSKLSECSDDSSSISDTSKGLGDNVDTVVQQQDHTRGHQRSAEEYPSTIQPRYNPGEISLNMHPEPMYHPYRRPPPNLQILMDTENSGFMNEIYF